MFTLACPRCHTPLERIRTIRSQGFSQARLKARLQLSDKYIEGAVADQLVCTADQLVFECVQGVWRMLLPEREAAYQQFIREYETVRRAEGRASPSAAYYQALPYRDLSGNMAADWRIRATSFDFFLKRVLNPTEQAAGHPLNILDLGAGNGWLSNRLAGRGHFVAAVDLTTNDFDGLGCYRHYETTFTPVQAEFDHLPFVNHSADLVLFNASLHYSTSYEKTLQESSRVLDPAGQIVILDTPFYRDKTSGEKMVQERQDQFSRKFGFPSNALASENYLTYERIAEVAERLGFGYQLLTPFYGLGWALRPLKARLLRRREPAKFHLVVLNRLLN